MSQAAITGRQDERTAVVSAGNGSLLLAAAIMAAGYDGCDRQTPGFPDDGQWIVEFENIDPLPGTSPVSPID